MLLREEFSFVKLHIFVFELANAVFELSNFLCVDGQEVFQNMGALLDDGVVILPSVIFWNFLHISPSDIEHWIWNTLKYFDVEDL